MYDTVWIELKFYKHDFFSFLERREEMLMMNIILYLMNFLI